MDREINFKELETYNVANYLAGNNKEVPIEEILEKVDVNKLRIYPIIIDLKQLGLIDIVSESPWGAPRTVKWKI